MGQLVRMGMLSFFTFLKGACVLQLSSTSREGKKKGLQRIQEEDEQRGRAQGRD